MTGVMEGRGARMGLQINTTLGKAGDVGRDGVNPTGGQFGEGPEP